jgi:REase_DpnII-MboI
MDYNVALSKLENLLVAMKKIMTPSPQKDDYESFCTLYGEVEELVRRFGGENRVEVPLFSGAKSAVYPNFIEAGFLSGRTIHRQEGYAQLLKIIGKVRQASSDPHSPPAPPTVTNLIQTLRRFRECCQYIQTPPQNEREVQDTIWIMLRSQYERVDREDMLPRFGAKAYRPDFGIPDLQTFVEVKFIGEKTDVATIQEEILADVPGYLNATTKFSGIVELVYDHAHKLRDPRKFIEDLRAVEGILDVIVVPGIAV